MASDALQAPPSSASANPNPHQQRRPKKVLLPDSSTEVFMTEEEALPYFKDLHPPCARCGSTSTHFRYFNNKWKSTDKIQPRYACKGCRRAFTLDGKLRNCKDVRPVGDQQPAMEPKKKKAKGKGASIHADLVMMPATITNAHNAALLQGHALGMINVQHHPSVEAQQYYYLPPPSLIPSPQECSNNRMPHEFYPGYSDDQLVHAQLQLLCAGSSTSTSTSYDSSPGTASTSTSSFAGMQQDSNDEPFTVEDFLQTDTHLDDGNFQVAERTRASVDFNSSVPTPDGMGHLILSDSEYATFMQLLETWPSLGMQEDSNNEMFTVEDLLQAGTQQGQPGNEPTNMPSTFVPTFDQPLLPQDLYHNPYIPTYDNQHATQLLAPVGPMDALNHIQNIDIYATR